MGILHFHNYEAIYSSQQKMFAKYLNNFDQLHMYTHVSTVLLFCTIIKKLSSKATIASSFDEIQ